MSVITGRIATPIGNEEEMLFFPYNSEIDDFGGRDRLYDAQDWADERRQFLSNGVYPNPSNGLRVESVNSSMVLTLRTGSAFIEGFTYVQARRRDFTFAVAPAHLTLGRRDIVVIRHDIIARTIQPFYIEGTPAATPLVPGIVRDDDVFDLQLCTITVNPNAQAITQANILDTRPNNALCGFVTGMVESVDTTELFFQYETYLNERVTFWEAWQDNKELEWDTWYRNWIAEREQWTEDQTAYFAGLGNEIRDLIQALETGSFTLINNNFDDWSVRRGCDRVTKRNPDGSISETLTVVALDYVLATRVTTREANGDILETVRFYPWEIVEGNVTTLSTAFAVSKRTLREPDGNVREMVR